MWGDEDLFWCEVRLRFNGVPLQRNSERNPGAHGGLMIPPIT